MQEIDDEFERGALPPRGNIDKIMDEALERLQSGRHTRRDVVTAALFSAIGYFGARSLNTRANSGPTTRASEPKVNDVRPSVEQLSKGNLSPLTHDVFFGYAAHPEIMTWGRTGFEDFFASFPEGLTTKIVNASDVLPTDTQASASSLMLNAGVNVIQFPQSRWAHEYTTGYGYFVLIPGKLEDWSIYARAESNSPVATCFGPAGENTAVFFFTGPEYSAMAKQGKNVGVDGTQVPTAGSTNTKICLVLKER